MNAETRTVGPGYARRPSPGGGRGDGPVALPYGLGEQQVHLPPGSVVIGPTESLGRCRQADRHRAEDSSRIVAEAVERAMSRLTGRLRYANHIALCVSDGTRATPHEVVLPPLLHALRRHAPDARLACVIATGRHRPRGVAPVRGAVAGCGMPEVPVLVHDPDAGDLVRVGTAGNGVPVLLNAAVADADLVICVGTVTPHAEAGFSGGAKAVVPGVAGNETISALHALADQPLELYGQLAGNPFRAFLEEATELIGDVWACNVGLHPCGAVAVAEFGPSTEVHRSVAGWFAGQFAQPVPAAADVLVLGAGGHPYDLDLYQAEGKAWRIGLGVLNARAVVLVAACPRGVGDRAFADALAGTPGRDPHAARKARFLTEALARTERRYLVSTGLDGPVADALGARPAPSVQQALDAAVAQVGNRVVVLAHPPYTMWRAAGLDRS